jgi:TfoX/Sxy family transcriptional regulator of competence genes
MAFNEETLDRIRKVLLSKEIDFSEKKMFMGVCIMVDDKMCCGTHISKSTNEDLLFCRISDEDYLEAVGRDDVLPMKMADRVMKNYIYVLEHGFQNQKDLDYWLQLCLNYNPTAKSSKKKSKH